MTNKDQLIKLINQIDLSIFLFNKKFRNSIFFTDWKIFSFVIRNQIENKITTTTSLINYSGLTHATGIRRIKKLIKEKKLIKRIKTKSGKSFSIHPSSQLLKDFNSYLISVDDSLNVKIQSNRGSETIPISVSVSSRYVLYPRLH
tara:strand:+ start:131 stop:565 length:435 start_codon:yes stop_codon:yes gene_type:complete